MKKIISGILLIAGISAFSFGAYISREIAAKEMVMAESGNQQHRVPLVGPVRKGASIHANQEAAAHRQAGMQWILSSQITANWLRGLGVVLFLSGIGCAFLHLPEKK